MSRGSTYKGTSTEVPVTSGTVPNNTNSLHETVSFSAKEDIPPIALGILIVSANGLVLLLVARNKHLRTITNFLLCSLVCSDLLTGLVSIPLHMTCNLIRTAAICIADDQMLRFTSVSIVCHLVAVCLDRYLAIMHSLRYKSIVTFPRCISVIIFIWITSAVIALAQLSWIDPVHHDVNEEVTADLLKKERIYDTISLVVFFLAPLICMTFVYVKIFSEVSRQIKNIQNGSTPGGHKAKEIKKTERKAVKIFVAMLFVYTVCWLPYFILRYKTHQHPLVVYITLWLRFLTSFLNPCLYTFGKKDFRQALKCRNKKQQKEFLATRLDKA